VILWAKGAGQHHRSEETEEFWDNTYRELTRELSGVYGAITSRAEAQVLRLSMIYALADKSVEISIDHLKAALAVWNYARDSVRYLSPVSCARSSFSAKSTQSLNLGRVTSLLQPGMACSKHVPDGSISGSALTWCSFPILPPSAREQQQPDDDGGRGDQR
jgi:hypothetical protein